MGDPFIMFSVLEMRTEINVQTEHPCSNSIWPKKQLLLPYWTKAPWPGTEQFTIFSSLIYLLMIWGIENNCLQNLKLYLLTARNLKDLAWLKLWWFFGSFSLFYKFLSKYIIILVYSFFVFLRKISWSDQFVESPSSSLILTFIKRLNKKRKDSKKPFEKK